MKCDFCHEDLDKEDLMYNGSSYICGECWEDRNPDREE